MKNLRFIQNAIVFIIAIIFGSCEKDSSHGNNEIQEFIVAFEDPSIAYRDIVDAREIKLIFTETAEASGSVEILVHPTKATYGVDFSTNPITSNNILIVPFEKGVKETKFTFNNLIYPYDRVDKTIEFTIVKVNYQPKEAKIQGYNVMMISFDTALGGVLSPNVGGPTQPNQVYVDLGGRAMYAVKRNSWDLAFFSDDNFRVKINGSLYMAAGKIEGTLSIDDVRDNTTIQRMQELVKVGTFDPANLAFIDNPSGNPEGTAIGEIKTDDNLNPVYLLNLGYNPGEDNVPVGSVMVAGEERGWKKIRILRREQGYLLQYADLNDTTHKEILIQKSPGFNFTFFSFTTESTVLVEPSKKSWDLNFTVFTNKVYQGDDPKGSYGYSDFILQNRYGGVTAYKVVIPKGDKNYYNQYSLKDVNKALLSLDYQVIGGTWRDVATGKILFKDVFYVINDSKGNFYKMKMLDFLNEKGERGYPKFEYSLLR